MNDKFATLFDLTGHVALITGGGTGIGLAIAEALIGAGAKAILVGRRRERVEKAAAGFEGSAAALAGDVADMATLPMLAQAAAAPFGAPDILVNAAGLNLRQPPDQITSETWDQTVDVNLKTPFFLARELVPAMRAKGYGRIVNLCSLQTRRAFPNGIPYGASKGGLEQLTRAMAEAWSRDGITANALAPGFFPTELTAAVFADDALARANAAKTAIGRNGRMEDLHGTAIFLAAPASAYVTGQMLYVDGGFTAK